MIRRPDWCDPGAYGFIHSLDQDQWAWEFLRRNTAYQRDWDWFITTWRALEEDYGSPPKRDFLRWQQDPRAFRDAAELETDRTPTTDCAAKTDQHPILIECWMGARWGFLKFPPDPNLDALTLDEPVSWRKVKSDVQTVGHEGTMLVKDDKSVGLQFDLSLPLKPQLESVRIFLLTEQRRRKQQGVLTPQSISANKTYWSQLLRVLDAEAANIPREIIAKNVFGEEADCESACANAITNGTRLMDGGYRNITLLPMTAK